VNDIEPRWESFPKMLWASLFIGGGALLAASMIATSEGAQPSGVWERPVAILRKVRSVAQRAGRSAWEAWDRRAAQRRRSSFGGGFSSRDGDWAPSSRVERIDWHERVVAVMELILFIVFLSALFAGALAAAALKFGHFHS